MFRRQCRFQFVLLGLLVAVAPLMRSGDRLACELESAEACPLAGIAAAEPGKSLETVDVRLEADLRFLPPTFVRPLCPDDSEERHARRHLLGPLLRGPPV